MPYPLAPPKLLTGGLSPAQISLIYALVGALWVLITDQLLADWISNTSALLLIQTVKDWIFVLATAAMLYVLIERSMVRLRRSEQQLRENHARLNTIIESTTDGIYIKDAQGRNVLINTIGAKYLGRSVEEVIGRDNAELLPAETARLAIAEDRQVMAGGKARVFEHEATTAGLTRTWSIAKAPYRDAQGRIIGVIGIARDITEHKQLEQALEKARDELERRVEERTADLRRSNELLQREIDERRQAEAALREKHALLSAVIENTTDAIFVQDAQGYYVLLNSADARLHARPAEAIVGRHLTEVFPPDTARLLLQESRQVIARGKPKTFEHDIVIAGIRRVYSVVKAPYPDADGGVAGVVGIARDITDQRQTEEKIRQQQAELTHMARFALAGELASGLAHELNQPLGAIVTYIEACLLLIRSGQVNRDELVKVMEKTAAQAHRAGAIIQRLRDLVRKSESHRNQVNVSELIQDVIRLVAPEAQQQQVPIRLELDPQLRPVFADPIQIQQVVLNLVCNAIEAMHETDVDQRCLILRAGATEDEVVEVTVSDTGPGLSEQALDKLFMPFFTTKATGMGLGLSITKSIIEAHEGRIWVTSNPDHGVTFHFTVPYNLRKSAR